ncbi:amino acid ABC transporter permease [Hydrogenophaga sp. PAMC20947]|uniref:amino acid ABC transporter permease n=1 Tax=Hydrogenophaga sp. PAMC20947 TaxID=2565558 RepID=UPI00109E2A61|nr:amino acid ABC transporter permease [Hydrogenophaga sp. PAMC20947]QCB45854.1 amino acid ABC transporter permease [Hydrogenophaga sp. PAMC20947]
MSFKLFMLLVQACGWTIVISSISIVLGLLLGTVVSAAMQSSQRAVSLAGRTFVSFFRGAPLLVQLLLIYNLLPMLGLNVPSMVAAIIGLSLCTAAYQAENLRGGFASVPQGLLEAADMLGLTPFQQFWRIRAPIALRMTLPALTNEAIMILKASSLVSVVGVVELTRMAQDLSASTFKPLPLYAAAALLYLVINTVVSVGANRLEGSFRWGVKA